MAKLLIKKLQSSDAGRQLVRLNSRHRDGIDRYGIAKLTNNSNGKSLLALVLGHNDKTAIYMPFDIRQALGVKEGDELDFSVKKAGFFCKLHWYVKSPDPAVHLPARIALIGLVVGIVSVIVGIVGVIVGICPR
jgi:hypothetical protein